MNLDFCFHIWYCVNNIKVWIRSGLYQQCIGRFMEWGTFCGTFWAPQNQLSSTSAYLSVVSDHLSPKCPVAASSRITFTKLTSSQTCFWNMTVSSIKWSTQSPVDPVEQFSGSEAVARLLQSAVPLINTCHSQIIQKSISECIIDGTLKQMGYSCRRLQQKSMRLSWLSYNLMPRLSIIADYGHPFMTTL